MMASPKITDHHLQRKAIVYVRQSSPQQVHHNLESQDRQYALRNKALALGWRDEKCMVIDEDLGISGARSENRPGYQKLISMVALREVGIIFGIEVSRLARNCLDWYQLLEVASTFGVLIGDEDTIYDPSDFNDRLLLGLKGTISEVELQQIKLRLSRGRLNKAKRGELELNLPIGYERDRITGHVRITADQGVCDVLKLVFRLFGNIGSVRGTLLELRRRAAELPYRTSEPGLGRIIKWRKPSYEAIYNMIKNPFYAGTYVYGKRKGIYNPVTKTYHWQTVDAKDWEVVMVDHHDGYITREEYKENINTLANNGYRNVMSQGAPRKGAALLQGIVYCARCGLKMRPRYSEKRFYYCCDRAHRRFGEPICGWASAKRVDQRIEGLILDVLNEGTVDLTFQLIKQQKDELAAQKTQWQQKVARLEYEANLSRRRYEWVDPENRLVASTLEREWEEKLTQLEVATQEFERRFKPVKHQTVTAADVKHALRSLPELWKTGKLAIAEKKEIIRCVIKRVTLDTTGKTIGVKVIWQGDTVTSLSVPKYLFTDTRIYERIVDLARKKTDKEIADTLNAEGIKTLKGRCWSARRVMDFRLSNKIASAFTTSRNYRLPESGFVTSAELAKILNVNVTTIQKWFKLGILEGRHAGGQSQLWIKADPEVIRNLNGSAQAGPEANSFRKLMKAMKKSDKQVVKWAKESGHTVVRLRRNTTYRFYVIPNKN